MLRVHKGKDVASSIRVTEGLVGDGLGWDGQVDSSSQDQRAATAAEPLACGARGLALLVRSAAADHGQQ
jgi:hypothetical protein